MLKDILLPRGTKDQVSFQLFNYFALFFVRNVNCLLRLNNVFIIGKGTKAYVSLPRDKGVKLSIAEERDKRLAAKGVN